MTLADIFPNFTTHDGLEAAAYKMQVPSAVTLMALRKPLNASEKILQFAVEQAREGAATVLGMADGQAGVDSVVVLPLPRSHGTADLQLANSPALLEGERSVQNRAGKCISAVLQRCISARFLSGWCS